MMMMRQRAATGGVAGGAVAPWTPWPMIGLANLICLLVLLLVFRTQRRQSSRTPHRHPHGTDTGPCAENAEASIASAS